MRACCSSPVLAAVNFTSVAAVVALVTLQTGTGRSPDLARVAETSCLHMFGNAFSRRGRRGTAAATHQVTKTLDSSAPPVRDPDDDDRRCVCMYATNAKMIRTTTMHT